MNGLVPRSQGALALAALVAAVKTYIFAILMYLLAMGFMKLMVGMEMDRVYWGVSCFFQPLALPLLDLLFSPLPDEVVEWLSRAGLLSLYWADVFALAVRFTGLWLLLWAIMAVVRAATRGARPTLAPRVTIPNVLWPALALQAAMLLAGLAVWVSGIELKEGGAWHQIYTYGATKLWPGFNPYHGTSYYDPHPPSTMIDTSWGAAPAWAQLWRHAVLFTWRVSVMYVLFWRIFSRLADRLLFGRLSRRFMTAAPPAVPEPRAGKRKADRLPAAVRGKGRRPWRFPGVVGQEEAKKAIGEVLETVSAGIKPRPDRPHAVLLLMGPTGVGKTLMAREIAREFYGDPGAVIRINMQEYSSKENIWGLLGTPPGYKDAEAGGYLTNALRSRPRSVLLLDEIEKGHPKVLEMFLTAFDEGVVQEKRTGKFVSLRECVVVMTSNLLADRWRDMAGLAQEELKGFLKSHAGLKDELLGRVTRVVVFHALERSHLRTIAERRLARAFWDIERSTGWRPVFARDLADYVLARTGGGRYGARALDQVVDAEIAAPLARKIREGFKTRRTPSTPPVPPLVENYMEPLRSRSGKARKARRVVYVWMDRRGEVAVAESREDFERREAWRPLPRHEEVARRTRLLRDRILGQDQVIEAIEKRLLAAARGLTAREGRPLLSMLFIGPSGVGKTETARAAAEMVFGDPKAMVRIDLGQFTMPGTEYRLFQSGGRPGLLTGPVSARPRCLVLLDEADKACPGVWDSIMTILDEGYVTEPETGTKVSFRECVVVLTANPPEELGRRLLEVAGDEDLVKETLARAGMFRTEFLGRVDKVAVFGTLGKEALETLVERRLQSLARKLETEGEGVLAWDPEVVGHLAAQAEGSPFGARKAVSLVDEVAAMEVAGVLDTGRAGRLRLVVEDGKVRCRPDR